MQVLDVLNPGGKIRRKFGDTPRQKPRKRVDGKRRNNNAKKPAVSLLDNLPAHEQT
jgi:hypothetical protein